MIVKSSIIADRMQIDGRRYITERHTYKSGNVLLVEYLADAKLDADQRMKERVPELETQVSQEAADRSDAFIKVAIDEKQSAYLKSLSDQVLTDDVKLTSDELTFLKAVDG